MKLLTPVHLPLWIFLLSLASFVTNSKGSEVIRVSEGSDVILPCSLKESVVQRLFDWRKDGQNNKEEVFMYNAGVHYNNGQHGQAPQFRGRVSHFEDQLKFGNASIKIINTTITDGGDYTCVFPYVSGGLRFNIKLVVDPVLKDRSGEIPGAVPKPTITRINVTDAWIQLKCEVQGAFPKPELRWKDSDGNILDAEDPEISERDGRYDISLQTTVTSTRTNCFQCVVQQKDLNHETGSNITVSEELFVDKCGKVTTVGFLSGEVTIGGMMVGLVLGALPTIFLVLLLAFKFIKLSWIRGTKKKKDDETDTMKPLNSNPVTV